jgi:5-methylthioribose kinase
MTDDTQFMNEVFAIWVERDHIARRKAMASHFHPDIHFFDHDGTFVGYEELEKFSNALQKRFPDGRFAMSGTPERMANGVRTFWTLGRATGMDFVLFEGEKVKAMYVFVQAPK